MLVDQYLIRNIYLISIASRIKSWSRFFLEDSSIYFNRLLFENIRLNQIFFRAELRYIDTLSLDGSAKACIQFTTQHIISFQFRPLYENNTTFLNVFNRKNINTRIYVELAYDVKRLFSYGFIELNEKGSNT